MVICQMYKWYTEEGFGCARIAKMLNEYGVKNKRGKNSSHNSFKLTHECQSNKHLFYTLIKCKDCGCSFRRTIRPYKNTCVRWVCSGHYGRGADCCTNAITVDEEELIQVLQEYFQDVLSKKKKVIDHVFKEFQRVYININMKRWNMKRL